jgi:hypothetical protein
MINLTVPPASSSSAPVTSIPFKMKDRQTKTMFFSALGGMRRSVKLVLAGLALNLFTLAVLAQTAAPFNLPLFFEANKNQTEFLSHGNGYEFLVSATGAQIALRGSAGPAAVQMQFPGADTRAAIRGDGELPGKINYLIGNDQAKWQTGLPTFSRVQIAEIYPGIDLVFHGNQNRLEYDFAIAPGANPDAIKIHFAGVDKISLTPQGGLALKIGTGEFCQLAPEIYQTIGGARKMVTGGYKFLDAHTVVFKVGDYDQSLPLVIDPVLNYSTYFGGNLNTEAFAIALETNSTAGASNGSIYIVGETLSKQFSTSGVVQTNFGGGSLNGDAFVAKFTNPATNLVYLTYLGGSLDDAAFGVAVDSSGNAFIAGYSDSTNFPTANAYYTNMPSVFNSIYGFRPGSAFVAELGPSGTNLVYSTWLGGSSLNVAQAIALDSADDAYVVGYTYSTNFPVSATAFQKHFGGTNNTVGLNANVFLTEIASNNTTNVYSTYLGGTNLDIASSVAVDSSNNVYVAGYTASYNFPTWNVPTNIFRANYLNGATNQSYDGAFDAFVTKFPALSANVPASTVTNEFYSTFLGGTNSDGAYGIAVDSSGCAYVTGWTTSTNFPVIFPVTNPPGLFSYLTTNGFLAPAITNAFLTKISTSGSMIDYSAVFGGANNDEGYSVAVDSSGNAFVIGSETSTNFPVANAFGSLSATNSGLNNVGISDVFVTAFTNDCSALIYSVLLGGCQTYSSLGMSSGYGIALDASDNAYITGQTSATNFPTANAPTFTLNETNIIVDVTNSVLSTNIDNGVFLNGTNDAFLAEILYNPGTPLILSTPTNQTVGVGQTVSFTIIATNTTPLLYQWQVEGFTNNMGTNVEVFTNLVNGGNVSGAYSNVLTITNVTLNNVIPTNNDTATYSVIVTYGAGAITNFVTLTVEPSPFIITTALTNQTVGVGATVTFGLTAFGQPPLRYQWSDNGINLTNSTRISGATTNFLVITDAQTNDSGTIAITVTNAYGIFYTNATLTVVSPPIIVVPAANQTVGLGATPSFSVTVYGQPPLYYSWQYNGTILTNGGQISGATTNTLVLTGVTTNNNGTYEVTVTNDFGSTNSSATLTVLTAPQFQNFGPASGGINNGLNLDIVGGTNGGSYNVFTSTNLLVPVVDWTDLGYITVNGQGTYSLILPTNYFDPNAPQDFFILVETNL